MTTVDKRPRCRCHKRPMWRQKSWWVCSVKVHNRNRRRTIARIESIGAKAEPDACWHWDGFLNRTGYSMTAAGLVHRLSYEHHVGRIPKSKELHHVCGVRSAYPRRISSPLPGSST